MRCVDAFNRFFPKRCFEKMLEVVERAPLQALQHGTQVLVPLQGLPCRPRGARLAGGDRMRSRVLRGESVLFASDSPFDPEKGKGYIGQALKVLESLDLDPEARAKINHRNAGRLFGLPPGQGTRRPAMPSPEKVLGSEL
jgi:hypothetical protein